MSLLLQKFSLYPWYILVIKKLMTKGQKKLISLNETKGKDFPTTTIIFLSNTKSIFPSIWSILIWWFFPYYFTLNGDLLICLNNNNYLFCFSRIKRLLLKYFTFQIWPLHWISIGIFPIMFQSSHNLFLLITFEIIWMNALQIKNWIHKLPSSSTLTSRFCSVSVFLMVR